MDIGLLNKLSEYYKNIRSDIDQFIKSGTKIIDIVNYIESDLEKHESIKIAFPVGININDIVAHYSPPYDCTTILNKNDLVKIDFGLHLNGIIIDSSRTYSIDTIECNIIKVAKEACQEAIKIIGSDSYIPDISKLIEEIISSNEYYSIGDLCGHQIGLYKIHDKLVIPNIDCEGLLPLNMTRIKSNNLYAIEPFVSDMPTKLYGDLDNVSHYMFNYHRFDEKYLENLPFIKDNYKTLCFDCKWLNKLNIDEKNKIINESNYITPYPPFRSINKSAKIAHYEDTIYVGDDKTIILSEDT